MSLPATTRQGPLTPFEQLRYAREIIQIEGQTVLSLLKRLDVDFCDAVDYVFRCPGSIIVTGMGKAGLIGRKIAATFSSTGTRSHYLHPAEAVHGDLGRVGPDDVVLVLSQSGETEEVVRILPSLVEFGAPIIAVTSRPDSTLANVATVVIDLGPLEEACALGLAPSASTTAMLAMGDALALVVSRMRGFRREDFARFHPAGSLGRQLSKVDEYMRPLAQCRVAAASESVRSVFLARSAAGRRTGAIMLTDDQGTLCGIFTDSDLARLFESRRDEALDGPIAQVMTRNPCTVPQGSMMLDAVAIMADRKISELPVIDPASRPVGLIDITDVVGLFPEEPPTIAGELHRRADPSSVPPKPKHPLLSDPALARDHEA